MAIDRKPRAICSISIRVISRRRWIKPRRRRNARAPSSIMPAQSRTRQQAGADFLASTLKQAGAALAADKAAVRAAQFNFNYTEIRAPFSGRLGRNQAAIGTMVSARWS
jgi:multidrug resistance efflux pump